MKKRKKNIYSILGIIIILFVIIFVIMGVIWTPHDPNAMNSDLKGIAPNASHVFGTDNFGRDILRDRKSVV